MERINNGFELMQRSELKGTLDRSAVAGNEKLNSVFNLVNVNGDDTLDQYEMGGLFACLEAANKIEDGVVDETELEEYMALHEDVYKRFNVTAQDIFEFLNIFKEKQTIPQDDATVLDPEIAAIINADEFGSRQRDTLKTLLGQYDTEYVKRIFSLVCSNIDGGATRKFNQDELVLFFSLPQDKQQKLLAAIEDGSISQSVYNDDMLGMLVLLRMEDAVGIDVLNSEEKISFHVVAQTGEVLVPDKDDPRIRYFYIPEYPNGIYEQRMYDEDNNQITITNYPNHVRQTVNYTNMPEGSLSLVQLRSVNPDDRRLYNNETIEFFDDDWNILQTVTRTESDVPGVQNVSVNGVPVCTATVDDEGNTIIRKDLVSPQMDRTEYYYKKSDDTTECNYKITAANGDVLYEREQKISLVSDNQYLHNINGNEYMVTFDDNSVSIRRLQDNETKTIDLANLIKEEGRDVMFSALKEFPADRLWAITQIPISSIHYDADGSEGWQNNGVFRESTRTVLVGEQLTQDNSQERVLAVLMHEFGHYMDSSVGTAKAGVISNNQDLMTIYNEEYTEFLNHSTSKQQDYISYFTPISHRNRPRAEGTAETNVLVTSYQTEQFSTRALYYQMFFPRTIAFIARMMDERTAATA